MTDTGARGSRAGAMIFLVIGVGALLVAAWQGWRTWSFIASAQSTPGVIAPDVPGSHEVVAGGHPMVEFHTPDGRTLRYRQNGFAPTRIGAPVTVPYQPRDPAGTATLSSFLSLWTPVLLPLVMGLGFIGLTALGAEIGVRPGRL